MLKNKIGIVLTLCVYLAGDFVFAQNKREVNVFDENQWIADQGDGTYLNPILAGRYADPSVLRVGGDYYMTHSGGSANGLLLWHSRDLVNWEPLTRIKTGDKGKAWAPDLIHADGMFFIYVTLAFYHDDDSRSFGNYVLYADRIEGPWSDPVDLKIKGLIDPGHVITKKGERFLYFSSGMAIAMNDTGDKPIDSVRKVYNGWIYPDEWVVECPCLESPKFLKRDKYYYLTSAMGGTSGPSTSHMAIVARSNDPMGPWENSPYNPLIRTEDRSEAWWSVGHATLIDDVDGDWWAIYHGYANAYRSLGRQTLLLPVAWTDDGWPIIKNNAKSGDKIPKPAGENVGHGMVLSDGFTEDEMGMQWGFPTMDCECNFISGNGQLSVMAHGANVNEGALASICPVNKAYEVSVKVEIDPATEGGLLFYGEKGVYSGVGLKSGRMVQYHNGKAQQGKTGEVPAWGANSIWLKLVNNHHDLVYYYSMDGRVWHKLVRSGNDAALGRTYVAIYGFGTGNVVFQSFKYKGFN